MVSVWQRPRRSLGGVFVGTIDLHGFFNLRIKKFNFLLVAFARTSPKCSMHPKQSLGWSFTGSHVNEGVGLCGGRRSRGQQGSNLNLEATIITGTSLRSSSEPTKIATMINRDVRSCRLRDQCFRTFLLSLASAEVKKTKVTRSMPLSMHESAWRPAVFTQ